MQTQSLGERIKELRLAANLSLRQLGEKIEKSPPFISDIELGRRFPSEGVLEDIAKAFGVDAEELRKLDTRDSVPLVKRMVANDPRWGLAFRTVAQAGRSGKVTPEQLMEQFGPGTKKGSGE